MFLIVFTFFVFVFSIGSTKAQKFACSTYKEQLFPVCRIVFKVIRHQLKGYPTNTSFNHWYANVIDSNKSYFFTFTRNKTIQLSRILMSAVIFELRQMYNICFDGVARIFHCIHN